MTKSTFVLYPKNLLNYSNLIFSLQSKVGKLIQKLKAFFILNAVKLKRTSFWLPILLSLPPVLIAISKVNWTFSPAKEMKGFVENNPLFQFILLIIPFGSALVTQFFKVLEEKAKDYSSPNEWGYAWLVVTLDAIVGEKVFRASKYFGSRASSQEQEPLSLGRFLKKSESIEKIVDKLYQFLTMTNEQKTVRFRVCLAKMGQEHIDRFVYYLPGNSGPTTSEEDLRFEDSLFSRTKKQKEIVIVEDITAEAKKKPSVRNYRPNPNSDQRKRAILGIPVMHTELKDVPYVLTIEASEPGFFLEEAKKKWQTVFEPFTNRIALECFFQRIAHQFEKGEDNGDNQGAN